MNKHILAVEDESAIADLIRLSLEREGYRVTTAFDVPEAKNVLANDPADLALVDWMLPGASGLELVRYMRNEEVTKTLPVIMLTARSEEHDITTGLDAGADDYITKPFSPRELASRINALFRRASVFDNVDQLVQGRLSLDMAAHRVAADGETLDMGHTEFKLLQFFMRNPDRVFSRSQLLDHVWGRGTFIEERTVDVHILRLRKLLKPQALDNMLQTVRGAGYRFSANERSEV